MQYSKESIFAFEPDPLFHLVSYHLFLYSQHVCGIWSTPLPSVLVVLNSPPWILGRVLQKVDGLYAKAHALQGRSHSILQEHSME